ncbi:MAG: pyridoxamine kinase [Acetobacter sp.]|nr:pyridoxamine kinase [Bacteroides sp.]MCM1341938.1 pyridoxamine kinase [Acetobacter sp.]MCM1434122.1 pyridoxamine kinase [Clostridiales bacterium]
MKKAAVINDLSGFGKCSLSVSLPIMSAMGIEVHPLPTAVLSNQTAYDSYECKSLTDCMLPFINEWKKLGVSFDAVLTGFAADESQLDVITECVKLLKDKNTIVVVDPVMADNGKLYDNYNENMCDKVKKLAHYADVVTPNIAELAYLADEPYSENLDDIKSCINILYKKGIKKIVVTGLADRNKISNIVFDDGDLSIVSANIHGDYFSGTGDILASIVTAGLLKNMKLSDAVSLAADFIEKAILATESNNGNDGVAFEKVLGDLI